MFNTLEFPVYSELDTIHYFSGGNKHVSVSQINTEIEWWEPVERAGSESYPCEFAQIKF